MRYLLSILLTITCLTVTLPSAHVVKTIKATKAEKEPLVLMPGSPVGWAGFCAHAVRTINMHQPLVQSIA